MRVFISYSTVDYEIASQYSDALKAAGLEVWFAPRKMRAGGFPSQLAATIGNSDLVVVLVSRSAQDSIWVEKEVAYAQGLGRTVLPVIIKRFDLGGGLALLISNLNNINAIERPIAEVANEILHEAGAVAKKGRVVASFNVKGGVGKTVLAANIAAAFALRGGVPKVLLVDLDPQYNLSQFFLDDNTIDERQETGRSILSVFEKPRSLEDAGVGLLTSLNPINPLPGFSQRTDLLVGNDAIFDYAVDLKSEREKSEAREGVFAFFKRARELYDLVMVDVNPSVSFPTMCALDVSDHIMAPVRPDRFAVRGLDLLNSVVSKHRAWKEKPEDFSVVLNEVTRVSGDRRLRMRDAAIDRVRSDGFFGGCLVGEVVPHSTALTSPLIESPTSDPIKDASVFGRDVGGTNLRMLVSGVAAAIAGRAGVSTKWIQS